VPWEISTDYKSALAMKSVPWKISTDYKSALALGVGWHPDYLPII
jgi:hypothetical protein